MGRTPRLFPLRRCNIAARCPCVHAWDVPVSLPRPAPRQHRPGRAAGWWARPGPYQLGPDEPAYRITKEGGRGGCPTITTRERWRARSAGVAFGRPVARIEGAQLTRHPLLGHVEKDAWHRGEYSS